MKDDLPVSWFPSSAEWEAWLAERHADSGGLWLKIAKKDSGIESVTYAEALEVALCYGWIDGQKAKLDDSYWLQRFTPRKPRSRWSKINRGKAEELLKRGAVKAAGLREIEAAKADGRWEAAYESPSNASIPDDLQRALDGNKKAREFFATLDSANRYAILYRVNEAKRPETRARRIEKFVAMLEDGDTIHPRKQ